ncbi:hypothetical protein [Botrimarina mediterranea]|uniref:hypothetical protein n=1 Tax=Botrimarina mediterranea TaxID=2528022 RepID=UPI00118C751A|nr:hypothetical protein K2D_46720 [Planctomycetes bacterium K2D]
MTNTTNQSTTVTLSQSTFGHLRILLDYLHDEEGDYQNILDEGLPVAGHVRQSLRAIEQWLDTLKSEHFAEAIFPSPREAAVTGQCVPAPADSSLTTRKAIYRVVASSLQHFHIFVEAASEASALDIGCKVDGGYWEPADDGDWNIERSHLAPDTPPAQLLSPQSYDTL